MRVALVCPYSLSARGGVQTHVTGLATVLRGHGLEVDVLAPADGPVAMPGIVGLGHSVPIRDNGSIVRVAIAPAAARRTAEAVRAAAYDIVHVHEPMIPAVSLAALLAAPAGVVGTFHMYSPRPRWYRPFAPLCRAALSRLDARIAVSEAARRHVSRICPGSYRVIPNGVDVAAHARETARREGTRILFVGRPEPRKGLAVLLEAFARLPGRPTLELVGIAPEDLPRAVPLGRVHARGTVSDEVRSRLLAAADVLAAPSLSSESFGVVLVEAMAAGVPVVASAIPGYVDVVSETCGRLVAPGDAVALAGALADLLAHPELRSRMGAAGQHEAWRFDWSRVSAEILDIYEDLLARRPSRAAAAVLQAA